MLKVWRVNIIALMSFLEKLGQFQSVYSPKSWKENCFLDLLLIGILECFASVSQSVGRNLKVGREPSQKNDFNYSMIMQQTVIFIID